MIWGLFGSVSMGYNGGVGVFSYPLDHTEEHADCSHCLPRAYKVSCHQAGNQQSPLPAHPSLCQRASFCMVPPVEISQLSLFHWNISDGILSIL